MPKGPTALISPRWLAAAERLAGRRILLVEDELLVAMMVEDMLRDEGCAIVGPVGRVAPALKAAREESLDAAVLDINLAGEAVYPVAKALAERKVPFVFTTGYERDALPAEHAHRSRLAKPFMPAQLIEKLLGLFCLTPVGRSRAWP
jgi:CheY-like chemotaxis protein